MNTLLKMDNLIDFNMVKETGMNEGLSEKDMDNFLNKINKYEISEDANLNNPDDLYRYVSLAVKEAIGYVDISELGWDVVARDIYIHGYLYPAAKINRNGSMDFVELVNQLVELDIYDKKLFTELYSEDELKLASTYLDFERDNLFTYSGLYTIMTRYTAKGFNHEVYELPQERFLVIALELMQLEDKEVRMELVKKAYDKMSSLFMTTATPTLARSGKKHKQFSSCFIDTMGDSLDDIYNLDTDVAQLSKHGGGIGVYVGKIRAQGSDIRGYKGTASGVIPWIKKLNNTAISVDQLGQRSGAIAVYLDVWHKDIRGFLDLRLNNGDERLRAHDIFTGVSIPDVFMEAVDKREDFYLFDPHEVKKVMGWSLEDSYDEEVGNGTFRKRYYECVNNPELSKDKVPAIEIMKRILRSVLEAGMPFIFFRDEVNRKNPNKHEGMIYSSNLCTEIAQNMSVTEQTETYYDENLDEIIVRKKPGDFVVCNLSSINLGKAYFHDLEELIDIEVRMLDNVIDVNQIPVPQAVRTNMRYRGIGIGTFGWHHLLALKGIYWESEEAVEFADELYEDIAYYSIKTSMELAKEKGAYPLFKGSDWDTGKYFTDRNYFAIDEDGNKVATNDNSQRWIELSDDIQKHGIRNGYIMAVAPNASTSVIAGSTASIDPSFKAFFHNEKKDSRDPVFAPDLDHNTYEFYKKSAHQLDQRWSIEQNLRRQRHIDQAISFNIYIPNNIRASVLLDLYMRAWSGDENGNKMKTIYYTRSTATNVEDCAWCHS